MEENGEDGWRDLDKDEKLYILDKALEKSTKTGKEDLACLLRSYHTEEEKLELTFGLLLELDELQGYAEYAGELSSQYLEFSTTKLYARALTEMLTSRYTNVKGAMIPYSKVIDKLVDHIYFSHDTYQVKITNIVDCTIRAYREANREVDIKFPLAYMKACIWSTFLEGNVREEQMLDRIVNQR